MSVNLEGLISILVTDAWNPNGLPGLFGVYVSTVNDPELYTGDSEHLIYSGSYEQCTTYANQLHMMLPGVSHIMEL